MLYNKKVFEALYLFEYIWLRLLYSHQRMRKQIDLKEEVGIYGHKRIHRYIRSHLNPNIDSIRISFYKHNKSYFF